MCIRDRPNAIQLAPPVFNVTGDLTNMTFPINNIATLPSSNPAGTVYRYTTDGSTPTGSSPVWDNLSLIHIYRPQRACVLLRPGFSHETGLI